MEKKEKKYSRDFPLFAMIFLIKYFFLLIYLVQNCLRIVAQCKI